MMLQTQLFFLKTLLRGCFKTHGKISLHFRERASSTSFPVCLFFFLSSLIIHSRKQDISFLYKGLWRTWDPFIYDTWKIYSKTIEESLKFRLQRLLVELQLSQSIWIVEDWGLCELFLASRPAMLKIFIEDLLQLSSVLPLSQGIFLFPL